DRTGLLRETKTEAVRHHVARRARVLPGPARLSQGRDVRAVRSGQPSVVQSPLCSVSLLKSLFRIPGMSRNVRLACARALIVLAAGCSGPADPAAAKVAVKGTVTLNGKPMPEGEISFDLGRGQPPVVLPIKDGSFSGEVFGGKNRVEVN